MVSRHLEEIRANPLFAATNERSFAALIRGAYVQNFPPHTELITEGEASGFLHIIIDGCVELFSTWQSRETTMGILGDNATFILAATIKDRPYLMSARTLKKSRIIMIPSEDVRAVFETDADFAKSIVTELASCYREGIKNTKNLKLRNSAERLANYVLRQMAEADGSGGFILPVEKRRIASFLGMTPENLSRAFASIAEYGVSVDGQTVAVQDPEKLRAFARPTTLIDS